MGLKDLVSEQYDIGNVHSSKGLEDFPLNRYMLEVIVHNCSPEHAEDYFKGDSEEIAALVEYIDMEIVSGSPFGYKQGGEFEENLRELRSELIKLM